MSAVLDTHAAFRREITYLVLPQELARHHRTLTGWFALQPEYAVVVERRYERPDRRQRAGSAPDGVERRQGERRAAAVPQTAAELGLELPWTLSRLAERIWCVRRSVPVHRHEAAAEADALFVRATAGDAGAREELRLRFHPSVHAMLAPVVGRRRALATTEAVFEEAFANRGDSDLHEALVHARERVLAH